MSLTDRAGASRLAQTLRARQRALAEAVTEEFLTRHPDWLARYGERARTAGIEDAAFHIQFLAAAVETGATGPFEDYASWSARVLRARGIAPEFLAENFAQIEAALALDLTREDRAVLAAFVRAGCEACQSPAPEQEPPPAGALAQTQRLFLRAILDWQRRAATTITLEALREGHAATDLYADVFQPALYEVGRLWEANRITVADEHMATAITQYVLAQVYERLPRASATRGRIVIAGLEGEQHHIGANIVADALEAQAWEVRFLGTNVPHASILEAVGTHRAEVLGISMTMLVNLPGVRRLIGMVRDRFPAGQLRLIVGGGAFRAVPDLWRKVGADAFAPDVRAAIEMLGGS